ncbi:MAG: malto-oligosyltrehalose synthase [Nitrospirae bacterium]|nr:malto-oligosyltrehalose synthase [Nitrospirota bacterium]
MEKDVLLLPRIPASTYRLQFNRNFRFPDSRNIIGYLYDLGISDIYASPYFKAKAGSPHGYDIVDHNSLNSEIGTEEEYNELVADLQKYDMGQVIDIVPNHMCIESKDNIWWMDVLENGPSSIYADYFDIDWGPLKKELKNKILLPVLGDQYGNILEAQELSLAFEEGAFFLYYFENKFPIIPKTYIFILKHRIDELENILSSDNPHYVELLSIITALDHLPPYMETDPEKVVERCREKEIIKKRLWTLYNESSEIKDFINENVRIFNGIKGDPGSFDLLDELLNIQAYRLSYWRVATEEINYRRFFDINSLAAIRMENPAVFEDTHRLLMRLIKEGKVTGLRIDHPDGLYDPSGYFHKLQRKCFLQTRLSYSEGVKKEISQPYEHSDLEEEILNEYDEFLSKDPQFKPFYIIGEKILSKGERMPEDWPIFSTTGYVFLNALNGIFVETGSAKAFDDIYSKFTKLKINFQDVVYEKKKLIMKVAMSSEINSLGHFLNRISEKNRHTRDFTLNSLTSVIIEVIAFFPVYRTYTNSMKVKDKDRQYVEAAVSKAKRTNPAISTLIFDFLKDVLLLKFPENFGDDEKNEWLDFVMRWQKITGPVMAKGLEDTSFYVYNRLVSLNEVGGSPDRFGISLEAFHGMNIERLKFWPHALIASSTHDSKRSEDVRARINVLSEIPDEWKKRSIYWSRLNKKAKVLVDGRTVPDRNEEYLLYQTLIGAWPIEIKNEEEYEDFKIRIISYMLKAIREAKVNTSWINPDTIYEDALQIFINKIMNNKSDNQFLKDFTSFQKIISNYGLYNSLSQTLLKITSPGVPDFYQGTDIWDFSLVDPDNRRPVDYEVRKKMLQKLRSRQSEIPLQDLARELTINRENGMIKLYLLYKSLNYRREKRALFDRGEYLPLEVMEGKADNVCAFARRIANREIVIAAPRFFTKLISQPEDLPLGKAVWNDSFIVVPFAEDGTKYCNIFTGETLTARNYKNATSLALSEVFLNFPVTVMERLND